jgi:hypothetical protein
VPDPPVAARPGCGGRYGVNFTVTTSPSRIA